MSFNLLNKSQTLALIAAGLLINGVIDVGALTAIVAAANLGAGLADFGYTYERGRFLAATPTQVGVRSVLGGIPIRMIGAGALSVGALELTIGGRAHWLSPTTLAGVAVLGACTAATLVLVQTLYSVNQFRAGSLTLGLPRSLSGVVAIPLAIAAHSIRAITIDIAVAELLGAGLLLITVRRSVGKLPAGSSSDKPSASHLWLGIGSTANMLSNRSDVLLVAALTTPIALGVYSVASQIENAIESLALTPTAPLLVRASRTDTEDVGSLIERGQRATLTLSAASTAGVLAAFLIYVGLYGSNTNLGTERAIVAVTICSSASALVAVAGVHMTVLLAAKRYRDSALIRLVSGAVAAAAFVGLTPHFGAAGAAVAAAIRDGMLLVLAMRASRLVLATAHDG